MTLPFLLCTDKEFKDAFAKFDADKDNLLNPLELKEALQSWGINFDITDSEAFARRFTPKSPAHLNFEEFKKMAQYVLNIKEKFSKHDTDQSDTINRYSP